jgi:hypothetical protein
VIGVALVLGFAVRTALLGDVDDRGALLGVLGAIGLLLYAWVDREQVGEVAASRGARHGLGAVGLVALAAVVGGLAYGVVRAFDGTVDLTSRGAHTLAPRTLAVLDHLDRDVDVVAFFPRGSALGAAFEALVRRYADRSPHLRVRFVDPLREPSLARQHGVDVEAGEVVLVAGERSEHLVGRFDEDALTDALVRVVAPREHVVCWSEGHGEADPNDTREPAADGTAVRSLEGEDFQVLHTRLLTGRIDPRCEAVVVAAPRSPLSPAEAATLVDWIAGGGHALVLLEPGVPSGLEAALRPLGIAVGDDVVHDATPERRPAGVTDDAVLVLDPREGGDHPIVATLDAAVLFPLARSVGTVEGAPGVAARVLLRAGPRSEAVGPDGHPTLSGDVPVGAASEVRDADALELPTAPAPALPEGVATASPPTAPARRDGGRVVVLGDATFASNRAVPFGADRDLFVNALTWLVHEDDRLGASAEALGDQLPITSAGATLVALAALVLAPGAALLTALRAAWRRRSG